MPESKSCDLPTPGPGRSAAEAFVAAHLGHLVCDEPVGSPLFSGGQTAADSALAAFDVSGYARRRNEVHPPATATSIQPAEVHPWPWLISPAGGSIASFSAWRRS